jgi:hypothetical protein
MRSINLVNRSSVVTAADFCATVAAVQKQISNDFAPRWGIDAKLTTFLEDIAPERIYILDNTTQADALGYHTESSDVPVGYIFAKTDLQATGSWSDTLSHEVLEQLADPLVNLTALAILMGTYPVLFSYENADPVENDVYLIDGVKVSNFVFPNWFATDAAGQVDFMGTLPGPFTISRGGYLSYQTRLGTWAQVTGRLAPDHQRTPGPHSRRARRRAKRNLP